MDSSEGKSRDVEVLLHPHLGSLTPKMLSGEYRDSGGAGRLIAVKSPPLDLLRGVASPHGSNISHFTSEDQLLQAYHIPQTVQQRYRYELLDDHPQQAPAEDSALMHDSCEPADSGGCSIEVQSIPSLAILKASSHAAQEENQNQQNVKSLNDTGNNKSQPQQQRHSLNDQQERQHAHQGAEHACTSQQANASSPAESAGDGSNALITPNGMRRRWQSRPTTPPADRAQPSRPDNASGRHRAEVERAKQSPEAQQMPKRGSNRRLTALEQLLDSLPNIELGASPGRSLRTADFRVRQHSPEPAQHGAQKRSRTPPPLLVTPEAQKPAQQRIDMATDGRAMQDLLLASLPSEDIRNEPASTLYAQLTQKDLRKAKKKGMLVPEVDTALQACRAHISPGVAAVQPSPDSPDILVRASENLPPAHDSAGTPSSKTRRASAAANGRTRAAPEPESQAEEVPRERTRFIADLQLDLTARVLAKQPDLAHKQLLADALQGRSSHAKSLFLPERQKRGTAACMRQAVASGGRRQTAGRAPFTCRDSSVLLPFAAVSLQDAPSEPSRKQRSWGAASDTAQGLQASWDPAQSFQAMGGHSNGLASMQNPPMPSQVDMTGLANVMAASEQNAAALERQLVASQRKAALTGNAGAGLWGTPGGQHSIHLQSLPGIPILLQPDSQQAPVLELHRQTIASYINAGTVVRGRPISIHAHQGQQQTAAAVVQGAKQPSHERQAADDALSAALHALRQEVLLYTEEAAHRHSPAGQASHASGRQSADRHADTPAEYQFSLATESQTDAGLSFGSPSLLPVPEAVLTTTPLAEDTSLTRLWHGPVKKRRSISSSERPSKSPRSESLTAGTPVGAASGFPSPWQTASPTLLMSTPSARMSRATEYLDGLSPDLLPQRSNPVYASQLPDAMTPSSHDPFTVPGTAPWESSLLGRERKGLSPKQKGKQQMTWLQAHCRDVAPDLELLELQQISHQLHLLLGQCGSIHPSEPGFGPFARSILKLLEHLLVFPMTTQLLSNVNIIVPVHKCSKFPQEDVSGFAGYLLCQWQSLLSSSLCLPDLHTLTAASDGLGALPVVSAPPAQSGPSARAHTPQQDRQGQRQQAKRSVHATAPAAQPRQRQSRYPTPSELRPEAQGFRPWSSLQAQSEGFQPLLRGTSQAAEAHMLSVSALVDFARPPATASAAVDTAAGLPSMALQAETGGMLLHSILRAGAVQVPWDQGSGAAQAQRNGHGFHAVQQQQSMAATNTGPSELQAFGSTFLGAMQLALSSPPRSPAPDPEHEQQTPYMTREEMDSLFPYLLQEQDCQMPSMAPQLGSSAPQQQNTLHPANQGMRAGRSNPAIGAVAGGSSVFIPVTQGPGGQGIGHGQPQDHKPACADGRCMTAPGEEHPQGSTNHSLCNGKHCEPGNKPSGGCHGPDRTSNIFAGGHGVPAGQHYRQEGQPGRPPAPADMASGVDVSIHEAEAGPPGDHPAFQHADEAPPSPEQPEPSQEETVLSGQPRHGCGRAQKEKAAVRHRSRATPVKHTAGTTQAWALAGHKPSDDGGRAQRAKRRVLMVAQRAAWAAQDAEQSAAGRSGNRDLASSSGLDGSQGAAWGLATMLQKGSRANLQPSKEAPSSRYVSREVAGALDEIINAIKMPSQPERPEQSDPAQSEAVDQAAGAKAPGSSEPEGAGGTANGGLSAEKAGAADIAVEGVAVSSLNRDLATEAAAAAAMATDADTEAGGMTLNSIRVVWSRKEEELYKEVLRQHGRSMARLSAAFPAKPSKSITKFFNNRKKAMGLVEILQAAGHTMEIIP